MIVEEMKAGGAKRYSKVRRWQVKCGETLRHVVALDLWLISRLTGEFF